MPSVVTTTTNSNYQQAEYLVRKVGEEATQKANIRPLVWEQDIQGQYTMAAHFRAVEPLAVATQSADGSGDLPQISWNVDEGLVSAAQWGFYIAESKTSASISPDSLPRIASQASSSLSRAVDSSLAALFPSLTGGTVGTGGAALTVAQVLQAEANLFKNHAEVGGQFFGVLAPQQFYDLKIDMLSKNAGIAKVDVDGRSGIAIGSITFLQSTLVGLDASGANNAGAVFSQEALGLVIAKSPMVEINTIPKQAAWAVEATIVYGVTVVRPTFGCYVMSGKNA